jgi:deoxyhypusine synthase
MVGEEKQLEEMRKEVARIHRFYLEDDDYESLDEYIADMLYNAGYRKQSEDMVSISTVKKWIYEIAINNVGCVLDGDFSTACEEIISRLDGLKRFAEEMKGGAE